MTLKKADGVRGTGDRHKGGKKEDQHCVEQSKDPFFQSFHWGP